MLQKKTILAPVQKVRLKFAKKGEARFISHLDLMVAFNRALRRAKIPLAYSQGFNPHPSMSFGPPLAIGFESDTELADIELTNHMELGKIVKSLVKETPPGLEILEAQQVPAVAKSLMASIIGALYSVKVEGALAVELPVGVQITNQHGNIVNLLMELPLGEKNKRPDKVCAEILAPGYKVLQIKRIQFLFK